MLFLLLYEKLSESITNFLHVRQQSNSKETNCNPAFSDLTSISKYKLSSIMENQSYSQIKLGCSLKTEGKPVFLFASSE